MLDLKTPSIQMLRVILEAPFLANSIPDKACVHAWLGRTQDDGAAILAI